MTAPLVTVELDGTRPTHTLRYRAEFNIDAVGEVKGPDTVGGLVTIVRVEQHTDHTLVGFVPGARCSLCARMIDPAAAGPAAPAPLATGATHDRRVFCGDCR